MARARYNTPKEVVGCCMKRLRELFDSIVFAGMNGSAPADPLYLTNRSLGRTIKSWSLVAIPCLFIVGLVAFTLSKDYSGPPEAAPRKEPSAEETARKILPDIARDIKIDSNKDVEVVQVRVDRSAMKLAGTVRNNTAHAIAVADVVFDLANTSGSQVGAVRGHIENLPPKTAKDFEFPIKQRDATFVLVRELSTSR